MTALRIGLPVLARRVAFRLGERGAFVVLTLAIIGFYILMRAPVLDPPDYLDPWIYTATFFNYHYIVNAFPGAYYPSRLPWILPGIVAHDVLPPVPAFFVLHLTFFLSAGLFLFLLVRRFLGTGVAFVAYAALMLLPLFYDAYADDYPDGAILTYLFGAAYFGLGNRESRYRLPRMVLAGFCLAGAVATNLFAGVTVVGVVLIYFALFHVERRFIIRMLLDGVAVAAGMLVLLIICGTFSKIEGGGFLFFMPQVREAQSVNAADYKAHGYEWLRGEPQLLLPPFLLVALAMAIPRGALRRWRSDPAVRFAVGAGASLAYLTAFIAVWEFAFTGDFLETYYYFSLFIVAMMPVLASVLFFVVGDVLNSSGRGRSALVCVATVAFAAPTFMLYRLHRGSFGERPAVACIFVMALFIAALVAGRGLGSLWPTLATAIAALVLLVGVAYAGASGSITQTVFSTTGSTFNQRRDVLSVALQLMSFVKDSGLQRPTPGLSLAEATPRFWYNPATNPALNGIQSTYLWADTWIGLNLPRLDAPTRGVLDARRPPHLILLCVQQGCSGARGVLARAGYANTLLSEKLLAHGSQRVWAIALSITKFATPSADAQYYAPDESPFATQRSGEVIAAWNLATGALTDWSGAAINAARMARGGPFATSTRQWDYELTSPGLTLQPGVYHAYLSGRARAGGLDLGILDTDSDSWLAQGFYWHGQQGSRGLMTTSFTLTSPTAIQVVMSNWVSANHASRWSVGRLELTRTGA